jgi:FKBP-type peptidyl-prolyl cis-trans isomerase 2
VLELKVEDGDIVKLEYTGKYETGEIFDTSNEETAKSAGIYIEERNYEPLTVKAGIGEIIPGVDEALIGMEKGEEKEITVPPEKGYGERRSELVQRIPIFVFRQSGIEPRQGMIIRTAQGQATITNVFEEDVELDFNHPLAGKTLIFTIKVKDIIKE